MQPQTLRQCYERYCGFLYGLAALLLVLCVLFAGGEIGLSNSGDFARVMSASSLSFGPQNTYFMYLDTFVINLTEGSFLEQVASVLFSAQGLEYYPSIHVALVRLSVVVNLAINALTGAPPELYRLGVLGTMYALMYAAGIGLLLSRFRLRQLWQDVLVKVTALIVLCDIGYVAYFNSFFGEALEHVALIYCVAMLLHILTRTPTVWDGVWCALSAVFYGWAKFFNIPLAVLVMVVLEGIILVRTAKKRVIAFALTGVTVMLLAWSVVPAWMTTETNYHAVFFGIVRGVEEERAEQYLADMGLPEQLAQWRDTNYFVEGVLPALEEQGLRDEAESITKLDLVKFYLTHPGRLWEQMKLTAMHSGMVRPYYLANHGTGHSLMTYSQRMSLWSTVRDRLGLDTLVGNGAVIAAFGLLVVWIWRRRVKPLWLALPLMVLAGGLAYAFVLPVVLNGEGDFAKHMFAYIEWLDLMLLAVLAMALDRGGLTGKTGRMCPVAAGIMALILLAPPAADALERVTAGRAVYDRPETGAYVSLGSYEGEELLWMVTEANEGELTLLYAGDDLSAPFDRAAGNDWRSSTVRSWLNGEFLAGFSQEELELLAEQENTVLLADRFRAEVERGDLDFVCSHIGPIADRGYQRAHQLTVTDAVTLPDIDLMAELAREGYDISRWDGWIETPYCRTYNLNRYVGGDGHIYFGAAEVAREIHPVIRVEWPQDAAGSGTAADPFVIP